MPSQTSSILLLYGVSYFIINKKKRFSLRYIRMSGKNIHFDDKEIKKKATFIKIKK